MEETVELVAKTLGAVIRIHIEKNGLFVGRDDLLVAFDRRTGRFVITFGVIEQAMKQAAE
jgi:hypothetical protein